MSNKITDQWQKFLRENKQAVKEKFSPEDFKDVYNTARMAHVGQSRRDGSEYFSHPSEVRNITAKFYPKDRVAQLAALLHDSLEDAPGSTVSSVEEMEEFIKGSIQDPAAADEVIRVVRALTHEKGGDYLSYVVDLMGDVPTLRVKLSDMVHNLTDSPSPKQKTKYKSAIDAISAMTGGKAPKGISDKHWNTLTSLVADVEGAVMKEVLSKDTYDAINKKVDEFGYNSEGLYELVLKIFNQMGDSEVSSILGKLKEGVTKERLATVIAEKILDKFDGDYQRSIVKPKKMKEDEEEELAEEPAKGKKYSKTVTNPETGRKKKVSYGAKGYRIAPGTSKGDSYCARSYGIKKGLSKDKQNDPNTPNNLSRKKWKCRGKKSMKENG